MAYLDHDHRERENIRFLAVCGLPVPDLRRSPAWAVTKVIRVAPYEIFVFDDRSVTKIPDARVTGVVYKDVRLAEC